jgi:NADH-quinone oxidoreductase subunit C/D
VSRRLSELVQGEFGEKILSSSDTLKDSSIDVAPADLSAVLRFLRDDPQCDCDLLLDVIGVDFPEREKRFEVIYNLRSLQHGHRIRLRTRVDENEAVPSASGLFNSANWHEREVFDLFGVKFSGHPDLRRLLCHHEFKGNALRKDYPIEKGQMCYTVEKLLTDEEVLPGRESAHEGHWSNEGGWEGTMGVQLSDEMHSDYLPVNIGPSHPATHGALRIEALLDGETIVSSKAEIGYLHRCFEKEAEDHTWHQVIPYTDRLNYVSALTNNVGYVLAVEKLLGVEIPPRAQAIRVIVSEMGRIMDHLVCTGTNLVDIGALTNYWYTWNAREYLYDIVERLCGERLTTSYTRIGGLYRDLYEGFERDLLAALPKVEAGVNDMMGLVQRNRILMDRTVGVGVINAKDAVSWGYTGPCLRASGVPYDVRKAFPYSGFENYEFDIPVGENGDAYDRIMVRIEEIYQSISIIQQAVENLPGGPIQAEDRRCVLPPKDEVYNSIEGMMNHFKLIFEGILIPKGEAYGFTEAANGELGFYCVSDGSGHPYRVKVRPPCFPIFSSFPTLTKGLMVPDAVAILGGLNIVAGELDR